MRVLVLHQAIDNTRTDETDTLVQVDEISAHLHALGHAVTHAAIATVSELEDMLERHQPDSVFNLVESFHASDRFSYLVPGVLEARCIPYTGNSALPLQLVSHKPTLNRLLAAHEIRVPRSLKTKGKGRYIVKSAYEHASFGLDAHSVVSGAQAAHALIAAKTAQYGGQWLAEEYIEGREFNLSLLANGNAFTLLPPAEILFEDFPRNIPHIVDYAAKWDDNSHAYHHTPRRFVETSPEMHAIALKTWVAINLRGYARIDLRMDHNETLFVIDVNPNPCLSADAGFMAAAHQAGLLPEPVIQSILEGAHHACSLTA